MICMKSGRPFGKFVVWFMLAFTLLQIKSTAQNPSETANPNASPDARAVIKYLRSLPFKEDKKLISGQFESWGRAVLPLSSPSNNLAIIHEQTGKWVGLVGVEYHESAGLFPDAPNQLCAEYWRKGGLVQIYLIMRNPALPAHSMVAGNVTLIRFSIRTTNIIVSSFTNWMRLPPAWKNCKNKAWWSF